MNTMVIESGQVGPEAEASLGQQLMAALAARRGQIGRLASIVAIHLLLFYLLQSGMLRQVMHAALPEVINISFIAPPAPPAPPKPSAPVAPKMVQVAMHQPVAVIPPPLVVTLAPTVPTITLPQAQAAEAAPAPLMAPPAPQALAPSTPRTVSGVEYIRPPQPVYPSNSRRLGESGVVLLRILIDEKGQPEQVTVQKSSGFPNLDEAGCRAARHALFKPHLEDGKPVAVFVIVPLNFQLAS